MSIQARGPDRKITVFFIPPPPISLPPSPKKTDSQVYIYKNMKSTERRTLSFQETSLAQKNSFSGMTDVYVSQYGSIMNQHLRSQHTLSTRVTGKTHK